MDGSQLGVDRQPGRIAERSKLRPPRFAVPPAEGRAAAEAKEFLQALPQKQAKRMAALDAIAPRVPLNQEQLATMKEWHTRAFELKRDIFSASPAPDQDWLEYYRRAGKVAHALWKAEQRLLGGEDGWNRYLRLRDAAEQGHLDQVDDTGRFSKGRTGGEVIPGTDQTIPLNERDTAEFDRYFAAPGQ